MISRAVLLALLAATAVLLVVSDASGSAADLTPEETLGLQIFFEGKGENGREITAVLGEGGAEVPAATLPCTGCHGEDGLGRPEGGLSPSDITWSSLTKPYGSKHPSGREHPPYTAFLTKRAVTMGLDAGGNRLHVAMPRYRLTHEEADALVAFLQRLGHGLEPGVSDAEVRIGVVLPPTTAGGDLGSAIRAVLEAAGARVNGSGGIYSRRIDLRFLEPPEPAKTRRKAVEDFLVREDIFALVASFIAGADAALAELVREVRVPLVGPFSVHPQTGFPPELCTAGCTGVHLRRPVPQGTIGGPPKTWGKKVGWRRFPLRQPTPRRSPKWLPNENSIAPQGPSNKAGARGPRGPIKSGLPRLITSAARI